MAGREKKAVRAKKASPRCAKLAAAGIRTANDFALMMSAVMSDVIEERIGPTTANAVCKAGSGLLKVVEMQHRYGKQNPAFPGQHKVLELVSLTSEKGIVN